MYPRKRNYRMDYVFAVPAIAALLNQIHHDQTKLAH